MSLNLSPCVEILIHDQRLHDWGLPAYQTNMAAAIDLFACIDAPMYIEADAPAVLIPSGIALLMGNPFMAATILPRSGMGHKKGLILGNTVGLIDPDYTGEIKISVWNRNPSGSLPIEIQPGERIAQLMFIPILRPEFKVVDTFSSDTDRGSGGFGSTGQ